MYNHDYPSRHAIAGLTSKLLHLPPLECSIRDNMKLQDLVKELIAILKNPSPRLVDYQEVTRVVNRETCLTGPGDKKATI